MIDFDKNSKTDRILDASLHCFKQYGFKRTSMADIAIMADMSRPALYVLFKNKTDIFRSLSVRFHVLTLENVSTALLDNTDMQTRLTTAILARIKPLYALAYGSPHGPELFDVNMSTASDLNTKADARFFALIEDAISNNMTCNNLHLNPSEFTQILIAGAIGLKAIATDIDNYETLVTKMVDTFFNGVQAKK